MSGNENDEGTRAEVPKDSSDVVEIEPTNSASNDVQNVPTENNESVASAVDEAKPVDQRENSAGRLNSDGPQNNRYMSDLMKASNLHCPFVWRKDLDTSTYLDHELDLLSSAEEMFDDLGFRFRRYIVHLVLCYHNFYKRNIKECMEHLEELERMMQQSSKKDNSDYLFNTINDALYHVIHSCRIYIFDTTEQKDRTKQILSKIKSYDTMNDANKAGLWAIRANVYVEYGYEGVKNAVSYMRKAVIIDPTNAFWHFMKGMFMGRLRRIEGGQIMPENEEFLALRTAIELRNDPAFIAFAGEAYLETAKAATRLHKLAKTDKDSDKQVTSLLQNLNEVAAKYFKRSIELKPNSSHLLFRCGKGLMNLPPPHQDIKMGRDFIQKGLEISPDSGYGNHAMAMFLDKIENNPTKAKECLDISIKKNNFPAHMDMIRIEFQESNNAQKLWSELEKMLELYKEVPKRRKILGEIVSYYLFIDFDLVEACFYMRKLIQMNSASIDVINNHKTSILPISSPIPLSDLVFNRIKTTLKTRRLPELCKEVFGKYIQFLIEENIEPQQIKDEAFEKIQQLIERGFKNKQMKPVEKHVRDAQKRVHNANEFEKDPCAEEELNYLDFYKNDLKNTNVGKTRGVRDDMMNLLHKTGQNPLPKQRRDDDSSEDDQRSVENGSSGRHRNHKSERSRKRSTESSRSSRRHRRRSYSSLSSSSRSSSSYSSDHRSSRKHHQSSRRRRRSPSSSSYSSSSSSSSDRRSKSYRRHKNHRRRSSSYDSKRSRNKHHRRDPSPDAKKKSRRNRSPSPSYSSSSESTISTASDSSIIQDTRKKINSKKSVDVPTGVGVATEVNHSVEQSPKTDTKVTVDQVQAILDNLSINSDASSSKIPPQPTAAAASDNTPDLVGAKTSQNGEDQHSSKVESSELGKKSRKQRDNRDDSDGSVKTVTSRTSGASKQSRNRRSRDRSMDSARTKSSHSSKRNDKSSRKRSSRSSSRSSECSSSRRHKRSEQRLANSPDLIRSNSATPSRSERRSKEDGRKDRHEKHSKYGPHKETASDSNADSSSSRRDHSTKNGKVDRRLPKESKHSEDDRKRQKDGQDRRSKTVSSQSSD